MDAPAPEGDITRRLEIVSMGMDNPPMGSYALKDGVAFTVFSDHAEKIELCLFDAEDRETARLALPDQGGGAWSGFVPGLTVGARYGYRVHGPYAPEAGHRFNANKLLIDPYARELAGNFNENPALYGYTVRSKRKDLSFDTKDSAPFMPKSVVTDPADEVCPDTRPRHRFADTVIYEAHVKGLTAGFPGLDGAHPGTVEALGSEAMIRHLTDLGITALELLPVHALKNDAFLLKRGFSNYWGYNTAAFFAPEPRYLGPAGRAGFRAAIQRLHAAGIEVILDVVYNHTAEGDHMGPTLGFRGLDNASYYRLLDEDRSRYVNDTGCGNTVNVAHPQVLRLVMDSLRHWVQAYGIDGFRFDLATTVAREPTGFDPRGGFLDALRQDPVLGDVKMIAEPWDIGTGGYQLGAFPAGIAEWSDRFRDDVRAFWRGDGGRTSVLAARLLGSADIFDHGSRKAWSSVNLLSAHDGFTLNDVVSYNGKHNEANGEKNRDGHNDNVSDNMGVEGTSDDPDVIAARQRRMSNMLATLFLSQGTPMLLAGDEVANSQGGNNNAYCQDNEIGWIDWSALGSPLHGFVRKLISARQAHPALRHAGFLHGEPRPEDGEPNVVWGGFDGDALSWDDPGFRRFWLRLRVGDDDVIVAINGSAEPVRLTLPAGPWRREIDSGVIDDAGDSVSGTRDIDANSVVMFAKGGGDD